MSPRLKNLSGKEVVKIFEKYGFVVQRTHGSHVRMKYEHEMISLITIPLHPELKRGTLHSIVKEFERCHGNEISRNEFYTSHK